MDTREVSVCSTLHTAHSGNAVQRRVKQQDGSWTKTSIPCPIPIMEYNEHIGAVDHSDQFIQYYSAQHKRIRWYRHTCFTIFWTLPPPTATSSTRNSVWASKQHP